MSITSRLGQSVLAKPFNKIAAFLAVPLLAVSLPMQAYAQDTVTAPAPSTVEIVEESFAPAIGACYSTSQIGPHLLDEGYTAAMHGGTTDQFGRTSTTSLILMTNDDSNEWAILSVSNSQACLDYAGENHVEKFGNALSILAQHELQQDVPSVSGIVKANFAPLLPALQACSTPYEIATSNKDDLGLVEVFRGQMEGNEEAVIYAPHFKNLQTAGGRYIMTVENAAENTACRTVLGSEYTLVP